MKQKPGVKSKYNPKIHDKSIKEIFGKGLFVEDFCDKHDIDERTYYNWRKNNDSFKKAADRGLMKGKAKWLRMPLKFQEKHFNYPYWVTVMKNKYGLGVTKIAGVKGDGKPADIITEITKLYMQGKIDDKKAEKIINFTLAKIKALECDNHEERLQRLEKNSGIN